MKKIIMAVFLILMLCFMVGCGDEKEEQINEDDDLEIPDNVDNDNSDLESDFDSIANALASGKSMKCIIHVDEEDGVGDITMYMKGKKIAMETTPVDGRSFFMVNDGVYQYSWVPEENIGFKLKVTDLQDLTDAQQNQYQMREPEYYDQPGVDINCNEQSVPDSKFKKDDSIDYLDITEMISSLSQLGDGGEVNRCAMCNMIPDADSKAQCLENC